MPTKSPDGAANNAKVSRLACEATAFENSGDSLQRDGSSRSIAKACAPEAKILSIMDANSPERSASDRWSASRLASSIDTSISLGSGGLEGVQAKRASAIRPSNTRANRK